MRRNSPTPPNASLEQQDWQVLRLLLPYLRKYRLRIAIAIAFLIAAKLASVAVPILLKQVVDALNLDVSTQQGLSEAVVAIPLALLIGYGMLRLLMVMFQELRNAVFARAGQQSTREISLKIFEHLHNLSLRFHLERQTGGLSRDIERGSRSIASLYHYMLFSLFPTLFEVTVVCGYLFYQFGSLFAAITLSTIALYAVFTYKVTAWRMQFRLRMNEADSTANTAAIDSLINYETVKYFANEQHEYNRYDKHFQKWQKESINSELSLSVLNVGQGLIISVGITLLLIIAASRVVSGEFTVGDFVMVSSFMMQLFMPLNFLGTLFRELKRSIMDIGRMFNLLKEQQEVQEKTDAQPLTTSDSTIQFHNVEFAYTPERQILHDVSFSIPHGNTVAVVGASGAGKSTLARLIFRFYDVTKGAITIGDQDIRDVTLNSLHQAIGIVPQDTVLFNDTLFYNIQYGRPGAEKEDVLQAIKMANLEQFVEQLPDGLDTLVGERGLKLSGGEKQRVAIARTLLKNPDILVLDEATSSLDSKTEQEIQQALDSIAQNRTTLVIAHRLSTVVDADTIIVLDQGQVVESGSHSQLLALNGFYARLWHIQQDERKQPVAETIEV